MDFEAFKDEAIPIAESIAADLAVHIFKEDHILYPTALAVLSRDDWRELREMFDAIGYCDFTPIDVAVAKIRSSLA
jgi:DUF438 domain-containing protein